MCGTGDVGAMPVKIHPTQKGRQCSGALCAPWGVPGPSHISEFALPNFPLCLFGLLLYHEDVNKHNSQSQRPVLDSPSVQPEICLAPE